MIYLGADWESRKIRCAVAKGLGKVRNVRGCGQTLAEVKELLERVREGSSEPVHAVIESGAIYWVRLFFAAGAVVHIVDGKKASRFAESLCSSGAKDDARDARTLAEMGRSPAHLPPPWVPPSDEKSACRRISRALSRNTDALTKVQQQLRSLLRETMPNIEKALPSLRARWALEFLRQAPTPNHATRLSQKKLEGVFRRFRVRRETRATLKNSLRLDLTMAELVAELEAVEVRSLVERLESLLETEKKLEKLLDSTMESIAAAKVVTAIPGIGNKLGALILAAEATEERDDLSVKMGSSPVFKGSGSDRQGRPKGHTHMRRAAHAHDRKGVYLIGRLVSQHSRWGRAMYQDARARGQSAPTAYRRIARSTLRIVSALRRSGTAYDESLYIERLKSRGVSWAMAL